VTREPFHVHVVAGRDRLRADRDAVQRDAQEREYFARHEDRVCDEFFEANDERIDAYLL
jgi:hypothetical protein